MAWVEVINDISIGPYFFNYQFVTSRSYLNMWRNCVVPELKVRRHNIDPQTIILMQDGAPIHGTEPVRNFLDRNFGGLIGRENDAMIAWPARSQDFNPLEYFVWSYLKNIINRRMALRVVYFYLIKVNANCHFSRSKLEFVRVVLLSSSIKSDLRKGLT